MIQLMGSEKISHISSSTASNLNLQKHENIQLIGTMADNALVELKGGSSGDINGTNTLTSSSSTSVNHPLSSSIDILKLLDMVENNTNGNKKTSEADEKAAANEVYVNGLNKPLSFEGADKHSSVTNHAMSGAKSNSQAFMNGGYSSTNKDDLVAIVAVATNLIEIESKPSKLMNFKASKSADGKASKSDDSETSKSVGGDASKSVGGDASKSVDVEAAKSVDAEAAKTVDVEAAKSLDGAATKSVDGAARKSVDGAATKSGDGESKISNVADATKLVYREVIKLVKSKTNKLDKVEAANLVNSKATTSADSETVAQAADGETVAKSADGEAVVKSADGEASQLTGGTASKLVDGEASKAVGGEASKAVDGKASKAVDGKAVAKPVDAEDISKFDDEEKDYHKPDVDASGLGEVEDGFRSDNGRDFPKSNKDDFPKSNKDDFPKSNEAEGFLNSDGSENFPKSIESEDFLKSEGKDTLKSDEIEDSLKFNKSKDSHKSDKGKDSLRSDEGKDSHTANESKDFLMSNQVKDSHMHDKGEDSHTSDEGKNLLKSDKCKNSYKSDEGKDSHKPDKDKDLHKTVEDKDSHETDEDKDSPKTDEGIDSHKSDEGKDSHKTEDKDSHKSDEDKNSHKTDEGKDSHKSEKLKDSLKSEDKKDFLQPEEGEDSTRCDKTFSLLECYEVQVRQEDSGSNYSEDSKLVHHNKSQSVCLADSQSTINEDSKSTMNKDFALDMLNDFKLVEVGQDAGLDSMDTDSLAEESKFRDFFTPTKNTTLPKLTNDVISTRNVEQKYNKHDCDFEMLLEAIDDVKDGMKIRTAALRRKVPYHRLYWFLKELHANSSDEEGDEDEDNAVTQRSLLSVEASKQSQATHSQERRSVDPSVNATTFHPAWKASLEKCTTAEAIHMLAGNSSISLKPVLTLEKSNSASSNLPATQTSSSPLSLTGPTVTEIAGCSLFVSSVSLSDKELLPSATNSCERKSNSSFNIETVEISETGPATKKAKVENLSSQHLESDITMKGDVATAPMPSVTEARSPMINIPVGIVKEFMSANSPLAADANRGTKSSKPTSNGTVSLTLQDTGAIDANGEHSNDGSVGSTGSRSSIKSNKSTKSSKSVLSNGTQSPITCNGVSSPRSHTPVDNSNKATSGLSSKNSSPVVTSSSTSVTSQLTAAASVLASTISTTEATKTRMASLTLSSTSTVTPMDTSVSVPTVTNSRSKSELRNFKHLSATLGIKETTTNNSTSGTNGFLNSEDSALDPLNSSSDMLPDLLGNTSPSVDPLKTAVPLETPVSTVDSVLLGSSDGTELASLSAVAQPVPASADSLPVSTAINGTALSNLLQNLDVRNGLQAGGKENSLVSDINGLKRSLDSDIASNDTKKQRLSPPLQDSTTMDVSLENSLPLIKDDASGNDKKLLLDAEVESLKKTASKLHKLKRMDLENLIIELFMSKLLHNHELGRYKTLCEKLEATLEANRKKTAQFHKEMDDLRKVTKRLREEHQARKEQLVTPIKIKRSVGIQAAPHIIQKGLASAHTAQATITPKTCRVGVPSGMQQSPGANGVSSMSSPLTGSQQMMLFNSQPSSGVSPSSTHDLSLANSSSFMRTSAGGVRLGLVSSSPSTLMVSSSSTATSSSGADVTRRSFFLGQPLTSQANNVSATGGGLFTVAGNTSGYSGSNVVQSSSVTGKGASVIDLTDEEEGRAPLKAPQQTLVKMVPNSASFVTLPVQSGSGMAAGGAQYVLVPSTVGSSTIMVTNVANNAATVAVAGGTPNLSLTSSATRLLVTAGLPTPKPPSLAASAPSLVNSLPQHPAPLPRTAPQQVVGGAMQLPPQPTLKLSHKANSIVLSWTMAKTIEHEAIASYQLYAYQESSQTPSPSLWKKVGSVKALELPMACTLTQFMPGHRYHFAVRAVDAKSRLGPFSDPRSIRLEK